VPRGRIIEIYGPESSGKTTLALTIIANAQKLGGSAVFIDAEHALDSGYAGKLGVDIANLHVAQPDTGEEALEIADTLVRSAAVDIVVIDSVAALCGAPRSRARWATARDSRRGSCRRRPKLTGSINKSNTCVIFINQIRMQIGVSVRQSRDHRRRPRAPSSTRRSVSTSAAIRRSRKAMVGRQPHQGEGGEEQGRRPVPRGRVRHPLQPGHLA
jgi:protein RecA